MFVPFPRSVKFRMLCAPPYAPYAPYVLCLLSQSSVSNVETAARDLDFSMLMATVRVGWG